MDVGAANDAIGPPQLDPNAPPQRPTHVSWCPCACGNTATARYPKRALVTAAKLKWFLRRMGVKAAVRNALVLKYNTNSQHFYNNKRISGTHLDDCTPSKSPQVRRPVFVSPKFSTKKTIVFDHQNMPASPAPFVSPVDVPQTVSALRVAATSEKPVRAVTRLIEALLSKERDPLVQHIDVLTNTVANAHAELSKLQAAAVQPAQHVWSERGTSASPRVRFERVLDDATVKMLTGWPSRAVFIAFHNHVNVYNVLEESPIFQAGAVREAVIATGPPVPPVAGTVRLGEDVRVPMAAPRGVGGRPREMDTLNMLFMVFFVLRTKATLTVTSWLFCISERTAQDYFNGTIFLLSQWAPREFPMPDVDRLVLMAHPAVTKRYGTAAPTFIADTSVWRTEDSAILAVSSALHNQYKSMPGTKTFGMCTDAGLVVEMSPLFTGSTSDDQMVAMANVFRNVPRGSRCMLDRGFIQATFLAAPLGITIIAPQWMAKEGRKNVAQFGADASRTSTATSGPRNIIERVWARAIKRWPWLDEVQVGRRIDVHEAAINVCFFLCNYWGPMVGPEGEELEDD